MLLYAHQIEVSFGDRQIFNIDELTVFDGERVGLIGLNGAGKSTLLKVLSGEVEPDSGYVIRYSESSVIPQMGPAESAADSEQKSRLGVLDLPQNGASGGEETRLKIAHALSGRPGIIFADEPTTNLDREGIAYLKVRLLSHSGALVLISHDRALLDALCTRIIELEGGKITSYPGNYSDYLREKQRLAKEHEAKHEKYTAERKRLERSSRQAQARATTVKNAPSRMGNSEARLHRRAGAERREKIESQSTAIGSRLERLEKVDRPGPPPNISMAFSGFVQPGSKYLMQLGGLSLGHPGKPLLEEASLDLPRGSRTALMGPNGAGKSTLLRHLMDTRPFAPSAVPAFFAQDFSMLRDGETMLENALRLTGKPETVIRTVLACLMMRRDEVHKRVSVLSGGERSKLCIACILLSGANLVILDEPTNHLDIYSIEALAPVLSAWPGTLLFVSHDGAFTQQVADRFVKIQDKKLVPCKDAHGTPLGGAQAQREDDIRANITMIELEIAGLQASIGAAPEGEREALHAKYLHLCRSRDALREQL